jgi:hypothetical protein
MASNFGGHKLGKSFLVLLLIVECAYAVLGAGFADSQFARVLFAAVFAGMINSRHH